MKFSCLNSHFKNKLKNKRNKYTFVILFFSSDCKESEPGPSALDGADAAKRLWAISVAWTRADKS